MAPLPGIEIREAIAADEDFVASLIEAALDPYYGGDHRAHASRIFRTHISGGTDRLGFFSVEQKMFVATVDGTRSGLIHVVGKRQGTYKISPLIVAPEYRGSRGLGSTLLVFAENYAKERQARQMYCTVAEQNESALRFFLRKGYVVAGRSDSHYKAGVTEVMLYKTFVSSEFEAALDRPNISVLPCEKSHEDQVRALLLEALPAHFSGIDPAWVGALFLGYERRDTWDVNQKYKLIYVALDRSNTVLGVAGATPKKGEPIKIMPFIAKSLAAFVALLTDLPYALKPFGRKVYIHITPSVDETAALQQKGWRLDAVMPAAYHDARVTQQWSMDIERTMRTMRVKQRFLKAIVDRRKTLEVRVGYGSIKTIQPGEEIRLVSQTESRVVHVKDVRQYATFDEMLRVEDPGRIAPDVPREAVGQLLKEIYPPDRERLGVFVLDIQPTAD